MQWRYYQPAPAPRSSPLAPPQAVVASGTELESAVALITNLRLQGTIRLDASVSTAGWSKTIYSPSAPLTIQGPTDRSVVLDFGMLAFIISMNNYPIYVQNLVLANMCSQLVPMPVPDYVAYLSYLVFAFTHSAWYVALICVGVKSLAHQLY